MKLSQDGVELIRKWEGCKLTAYKCSAGVWTIGIGHTSAAGPPTVTSGMTITQKEADEIFKRDVVQYENAVKAAITKPMNQNQFDALTSLTYNIGPGNFKTSTVVKRFNSGDVNGAAEAILMWNKAGGKVVQGLVNRRNDEKKYFLKAVSNPLPPEPAPEPEKPDAEGDTPLPDMSQYVTKAELVHLLHSLAASIEAD